MAKTLRICRSNRWTHLDHFDKPVDVAMLCPQQIELKRDEALTLTWPDGRVCRYPIQLLRKHSPSADAKALREEMARNPLAVLPQNKTGPLSATDAELIGRYALRITFSDGHRTGLYTWAFLDALAAQEPGITVMPPQTEPEPGD